MRRAVTLLFLTAAALPLGCGRRERGPLLRDADMPGLERQGDSLRAALERHRQRHGRYPASLAEAGVAEDTRVASFGPWRYARAGEGGAGSAGVPRTVLARRRRLRSAPLRAMLGLGPAGVGVEPLTAMLIQRLALSMLGVPLHAPTEKTR